MSRRDKPSLAAPERKHAPVFAALGDRTRLLLIGKLSRGQPSSISELTDGFHLTRQAVTKHLRVLEEAGLARGTRDGREIRFAFIPGPLEEAKTYLEQVSQHWDDALSRLKAFVEER
ncbi:MAG: metalloregulator ArsR/SmtB family transcription factor [Verrucomicrobiota bacterium]